VSERTFEPELELKDETFHRLQSLMKELTGVTLADNKKQLVFSRLRMRLRALSMNSFEHYAEGLKGWSGHAERKVFIDLLTTHETYFFRETPHFEFLKQWVAPSLSHTSGCRVWSAACSTGEETYSIAMVLAERFGLSPTVPWEVFGSDVSEPAVEKASAGVYLDHRMEGLPAHYRKQFFLNATEPGSKLTVVPTLKSRVKFKALNLNAELPPLGPFDIVFLRNMLIYFEADAKLAIVRRVLKTIRPGGYLLTGHTEYLRDIDPHLKSIAPAIYQYLPESPLRASSARLAFRDA
jgi:chemotaxis protein methyltransferase CheR